MLPYEFLAHLRSHPPQNTIRAFQNDIPCHTHCKIHLTFCKHTPHINLNLQLKGYLANGIRLAVATCKRRPFQEHRFRNFISLLTFANTLFTLWIYIKHCPRHRPLASRFEPLERLQVPNTAGKFGFEIISFERHLCFWTMLSSVWIMYRKHLFNVKLDTNIFMPNESDCFTSKHMWTW